MKGESLGEVSSLELKPDLEKRELLDRLGTIIRIVSGRMDVEVITEIPPHMLEGLRAQGHDPKGLWFTTPIIDPTTRKRIKNLVRIPPELLETEPVAKGKAAHEAVHTRITRYHDFVPESVMQQLGFAALMASAEERPTDQGVRKYFEPATEWIDAARQDSIQEGESKPSAEKRTMRNIPRYSQLCNLIVYEPHFSEEQKQEFSPEVLEMYESVREAIEKTEHTLPDDDLDEEKANKKAIERYKIIFREVWPKVKSLMEEDRKDKELQKVLEEHREKVLKQLSPEQKEQIEHLKHEEILKQLREILQQIFDELPLPEKRNIQKQVQLMLEKEEDSLVENFSGKLLSEKSETHKEFRERKENEDEAKKQEQRMKEIEKNVKNQVEAAPKGSSSDYERVYRQCQSEIDALYHRFDEIFHPNINRSSTLRSTGSRPSLPHIFRRTAALSAGAKEIPTKIFEKKTHPEVRDYAFAIAIDTSFSMDIRMEQVLRATVIIGEALNRVDLPFLLFSFSRGVKQYKPIDKKLSDSYRAVIGQMKYGLGNSTNTPAAVHFGSEQLEKISATQKFLIILTDGDPSFGGTDIAIQKLSQREGQHVLGIGIGRGTENVTSLFPNGIPNVEDADLVQILGDVLENMVLSPGDYV